MRRHGGFRPVLIFVLAIAVVTAACSSADEPRVARQDAGVAPPATEAARQAPAPANGTAVAAVATQPPFRPVGTFALSPAHGPAGTRVVARAAGLAASTDFSLVWTSVEGAWKLSPDGSEYKGREYRPTEEVLTSAKSDASGMFEVAFTVPDEFGFQHDVLVKQGSEIRNKAGFDVDMQVTVTPSSGPPGTLITVEARGIGWRQMQNSWLLSYDNNFTGWLSAVTTRGRAQAVIPATGAPGVHVLTVIHGDFTFPYLNMQQSPEPDRPQFRIPFTVTNGDPVLPADVAAQVLTVPAARTPSETTAIWIDPPAGIVGAPVTVRGKGLPANTSLELGWGTVVGNRVSGSGWSEQTRKLTAVTTDARGAFEWTMQTPDDLGGNHPVLAKQGDAVLAKANFVINPSAFRLTTENGASGTEFKVHLKGVGWTETANIYHLVYNNSYSGYACGFNSNGDVEITLRASGAPGWHFIDLFPGIYRGAETRPLNFRIPQLTYKDDHPGEVLPAFRFAFHVRDDGTVSVQ